MLLWLILVFATALVLNSVGELKMKQGDLAGAREAFEEAIFLREQTASLETPAGELVQEQLRNLDQLLVNEQAPEAPQ